MQELTLVKDFTVIMVVAGLVTLLFRKVKQPPILGYLIAGLLVGPYTLPWSLVSDVDTINLIADLGLILVFFGIGLEFSWSKLRSAGGSIVFIGVVEGIVMIALGYCLGLLMGLSQLSALLLGTAMQISSSAIVSKILRDSGKLSAPFARLVMGIAFVEDIISIAIFAILTAYASTGTADLRSLGMLSLQLVVFIVVLVVLGTTVIPRVMRFTQQFHSKEALLITSMALCFASAIFGQFLGLSIAIGAFMMGSIIGDTRCSEEVREVVTPVRQVFAAVFFVTMGMLIDISLLKDLIVPALVITAVFVTGKIVVNSIATFLAGNDGRTSLNVGMSMPQMGEFSLVIMKMGVDKLAVAPFLYPVVALCTAVTCFTTPYLIKASDATASLLGRTSPAWLKLRYQNTAERIQEIYASINHDSVAGFIVRHAAKIIGINLLIIALLVGAGTLALQFMDEIVTLTGFAKDRMSLILGIILLIGCLPPFVIILRNLRNLIDEGIAHILKGQPAAQRFGMHKIMIIVRNSTIAVLLIIIIVWFIPFMSRLYTHVSFSMILPLLIAALVTYIAFGFSFSIHGMLERLVSRAFLGKEHQSATSKRIARKHNSNVQKFMERIRSVLSRRK